MDDDTKATILFVNQQRAKLGFEPISDLVKGSRSASSCPVSRSVTFGGTFGVDTALVVATTPDHVAVYATQPRAKRALGWPIALPTLLIDEPTTPRVRAWINAYDDGEHYEYFQPCMREA